MVKNNKGSVVVKVPGYELDVEFDGFEDENYGNHWEVTRIVIDGPAAEQILDFSTRRAIEQALYDAVNGLNEEEL